MRAQLAVSVLLALTGCTVIHAGSSATATDAASSTPGAAGITLPPELDRVLRDYERAWRAHDAGALAALFAEDGFVLSDGARAVRGRDAIRAAYTGAGGELDLTALDARTSGDTGFIIGVYRHGASAPDSGKFVLALRRDPSSGRWDIAADMDNSIAREPPPPVASPASPAQLPFTDAVVGGGLLFVSGQIGNRPGTLELVPGGIKGEATQALDNMKAVLEKHGASLDDVVKVSVFLADIRDWPAFNEVYRGYFKNGFPARSALGASGLAVGARVEVECIARLPVR